MHLGNNRENIAAAMTVIVFLVGVGLLTYGITAYKDESFLTYLKDLVESISGGNIRLEDFDHKLEREPFVFIIGGGVGMLLGLIGLCGVLCQRSLCRKFYLTLLLLCFAAAIVVVVYAVLDRWGIDFEGENGVIRERFRSHWRHMPRAEQIEYETRLQCCDFDNDSPRRRVAVWLGGCKSIKRGCFNELLLVENSKKMSTVFIWAAVAFVILLFAGFNCMVDQAEI